jgi:hypothetical protein
MTGDKMMEMIMIMMMMMLLDDDDDNIYPILMRDN